MDKIVKIGAIALALIFIPGTIPLAIGMVAYNKIKREKK